MLDPDQKRGRSADPGLTDHRQVLVDPGLDGRVRETAIKRLRVELQFGGVGPQLFVGEPILMREQHLVHVPVSILTIRTGGRRRGRSRPRMAPEREIA